MKSIKYLIKIHIDGDVEILSNNLRFAYLKSTQMSGCQCSNTENADDIHDKCLQINALINQIEKLNK